jgi:hypothetical protein
MDGLNLYEYVRGNPSTLVDPTGQVAPLVVGVVIGVYYFWPDTANAPAPGDRTIPSDKFAGMADAAVAGTAVKVAPPLCKFGLKKAGELLDPKPKPTPRPTKNPNERRPVFEELEPRIPENEGLFSPNPTTPFNLRVKSIRRIHHGPPSK